MNVFKTFFSKIGKLFMSIIKSSVVRGLTDELLKTAIAWAKVAAAQQLSNDEKRAFVIKMLASRFPMVPESIIRLAVELAVQAIKKELEKP